MSSFEQDTDLRLVVLGRPGPGYTAALCALLGRDTLEPAAENESLKRRGVAAGRPVSLVTGPAWFASDCDPEVRAQHISALVALSCPGPHAFLLCVPVNEPTDGEAEALDVVARLLGPSAVASGTAVLFTHTEELEEDEQLPDYLATWRRDLAELAERCGGRYRAAEGLRGADPRLAARRDAVEELMETVERMVAESGAPHLSGPLYLDAERRVRDRQGWLARQRRRRGDETPSEAEGDVTEEEMAAEREEAERSAGQLDLDVEGIFRARPPSAAPPSLLGGLWRRLVAWLRWLPTLVRREALFGALVGLFVGGPFGGMVGASVGSVATEVTRRKTQKTT